MFKCSICKQSIGPKIKPIRVITGIRHVDYHNEFYREDEWGTKVKHEVDSTGTEITGEEFVCPADGQKMGIEAPQQSTQKPVFYGKPVFVEKLADPLKPKLIALAVHNALTRIGQASKRAQKDTAVAVPTIKWFVDNNKGYMF